MSAATRRRAVRARNRLRHACALPLLWLAVAAMCVAGAFGIAHEILTTHEGSE